MNRVLLCGERTNWLLQKLTTKNQRKVEKMIQRADNNGDGDVDFAEFCELMCVATSSDPACTLPYCGICLFDPLDTSSARLLTSRKRQ
jgi:hypothetical protein